MSQPTILYEDNHLLVVNKPCGWVVQGAQPDDPSLLQWGKSYIANKYKKPGNVFLAAVSRLDRNVSGVVPLARTSKCAERMNEQIRQRSIGKEYIAVVSPIPSNSGGRLHHYLTRDERAAKSIAHRTHVTGGLEAILDYETIQTQDKLALLKVNLITGRKHQIRCQLAAIGSPIVGDAKYSSAIKVKDQLLLHCFRVSALHPTTREAMVWTTYPTGIWSDFGFDVARLFDFKRS